MSDREHRRSDPRDQLEDRRDRAIELYTEAASVDSTWIGTAIGRATAYAMQGRYEQALAEIELFDELAETQGMINTGYESARAQLLAEVGRFEEAERLLSVELERNLATGVPITGNGTRITTALVALQSGKLDVAVDQAEMVVANTPNTDSDFYQREMAIASHGLAGVAEVRSGDLTAARAHLADMESFVDRSSEAERWFTDSLKAEIELAAGRPDDAEVSFRAALPEIQMRFRLGVFGEAWTLNNIPWRDGLARALRAQGDLAGAIAEYRNLLTPSPARKFVSFLEPRSVLELARLLDEAGEAGAAAFEYSRFAELWKDADPDLQPLVEEARRKAAELGANVTHLQKMWMQRPCCLLAK